MKKECDKSYVVPPKTVIFCHPAAVFQLDENIRGKAVFIEDCNPENTWSRVMHYEKEIRKAANSDKLYVVVKYNQFMAECFEALLTDPDSCNYKDWSYMTFFHDDEAYGTKEKISRETKRDILINMSGFAFMMRYTVKYGYTVTEQDIKAINDFWKEPEDIDSFEKFFTNPSEPPFPYYDDYLALKELFREKEKKPKERKSFLRTA